MTTNLKPLSLPSQLAKTPRVKPHFAVSLKNKNQQEIIVGDPKATRALVAIMNMYAVNGGAACHWGGPSALAEIMAALHGIMFHTAQEHSSGGEWYDHFNFVNDAGHTENGIYALRANLKYGGMKLEDLWGFRSINSPLTGHGESHIYPQGVLLSNGPLGSAFPQAQGLCLGDKILGNQRTTVCTLSDGAAMEGEAKEAFAAIPGLAKKGKMNPFVLILSDNNTKLSGRIDKDSFDMNPTFEAMKTLGWKTFLCSNGHDLQEVYSVLEQAIEAAQINPTQPVFVHFKTIKGYGVKSTVDSASGGHGFPLKKNDQQLKSFIDEIFHQATPEAFQLMIKNLEHHQQQEENRQISAKKNQVQEDYFVGIKSEKVQAGISRALIKAAEEGYPVYSISADLQSSTGVQDFQKKFPDRFLDIGVAESNMINTAAGLSKIGFIPVVDTFAQFGITKGNLPLTMSSLSDAPVIGIFSHTGFQDAADGASHQATTYFAATSSIPQTVVITCACSDEAEYFLYEGIKWQSKEREKGHHAPSLLFFIGRENFPQSFPTFSSGSSGEKMKTVYQWGKAQTLYSPAPGVIPSAVIVASGPMVKQVFDYLPLLKAEGIDPIIVNNSFINQPDTKTIAEALSKTPSRKLLTIEDHQVVGGMGSLLTHQLKRQHIEFKLHSLGIQGHFGRSAYSADELYQHFSLGAKEIITALKA